MNTEIKVVVTGGAGFIGSHLAKGLMKYGYEVHIIDNLWNKSDHTNLGDHFHKVDIMDFDTLVKIFKGATYVFHTAALPRVQYSIDFPCETAEVNTIGTIKVLQAAVKAGVKRVIYSASSSAYGDQDQMPLEESMIPNPMSPYAIQKYDGEMYCKTFSSLYGLETVSLRYFNVYGEGQDPNGAYACVIAKFLKQKRDGIPLTITGNGEQSRDFTHVDDVVWANILAMKSGRVGKGEVINIGAGTNVSVNEVAETIGGLVDHIAKRPEPHMTLASTEKASKLLGWKPATSFKDGIKELMGD